MIQFPRLSRSVVEESAIIKLYTMLLPMFIRRIIVDLRNEMRKINNYATAHAMADGYDDGVGGGGAVINALIQ